MYLYDNSLCFYNRIGRHGIIASNTEVQKEKTDSIFKELMQTNNSTPYYKVIHKQDISKCINECKKLATHIKNNFESYVFIGMGGAILNPMMITSIGGHHAHGKYYFLNTTDPVQFNNIRAHLNLEKTAFIIISNSGKTMETISLLGAFVQEFKKENLDYTKNFFFCVGQGNNALRSIVEQNKWPVVEYDIEVGGRFSCFSNSSILPALIVNFDLEKYISGANSVVEDFWHNKVNSRPVQAALTLLNAKQNNLVLWSYSYNLNAFLEWYCQIISESLGKNNAGYTPIRGICPMDHHSMLQVYLDGPSDKLYTLIYSNEPKDIEISKSIFKQSNNFISGSLGETTKVLYQTTKEGLINKQLPVRTLEIPSLNEQSLGALIMHCSMEIIFLARMLGLNPFDQPAIDAIKNKAQSILMP